MYYEELFAEGKWWFRTSPTGPWEAFGYPKLYAKLAENDARIAALESAAVASALRVKELEKALRQIDSGTEDGWILGSAEMQQIARSALMVTATLGKGTEQ
jgi:hypothetical protein